MSLRTELDRGTVEERVLLVIRELLQTLGGGRALAAVGPRASLERELGLGSLERVELLARLEAEFGFELAESVLAEARTPADLVEAVLRGESAAAPSPTRRAAAATAARLPPPEDAQTLVEVLRLRAEAEPARPHIYLQEEGGEARTLRYGDLLRSASAVAGGFAEAGVEPGETVALMLPTGEEFFAAFLGVQLAGGIPVPLYPPFSLDRIAEYTGRQSRILTSAGARILITVSRGQAVGQVLRSRVPSLREVTTVATLAGRGRAAPTVALTGESPALIQYTSGSTGDPKGVLLTHQNLLANVRAIAAAVAMTPTDVGVSWLPLYHDMGLIGCWFTPLYFGIPVAILSPLSFLSRPERWLWTIHTRRATLTAAPNFAYELCVRKVSERSLEGLDLSCWRAALNGAEPVLPDTLERFARKFAPYGFRPEALLPVYGLAESTVALTVPPLGRPPRVESVSRKVFETEGRAEPAPSGERSPIRFVSVGRPLPAHQVRIVDDQGREQPERREGQLLFRGPSTMKGYYRNPEATAAIFKGEGWVDSGDRAFLADGEVFITGRVKDVVIRGGRNYYPQEIEAVVSEVEGVRRGCVVAFGAPDAREGTERLVVVAETRAMEAMEKAALVGAIQERLADALGVPADVLLLVPPRTVPKTSSGKLRRSASREQYLKGELGKKRARAVPVLAEMAVREGALRAGRLLGRAAHLAYGFYFFLLAVALTLPFWLLAKVSPSPPFLRRAVRLGTRFFLRLSGCRLRVEGAEHLSGKGPFVLVSNHASYLDPVPLLSVLEPDFAFVVKREAGHWPVIGTFVRKMGYLLVERAETALTVADAARLGETLAEGRSVHVFPEATFTRATGLRPFKLGAFKLAAESGRPILPISLVGTRRLLRDGTWLPRRTDLVLSVAPPLSAGSTSLEEIVRLREATAEIIARRVGEPRLDLAAAGPVAEGQESDR
jgi:fatty-acyl-CoA synthase